MLFFSGQLAFEGRDLFDRNKNLDLMSQSAVVCGSYLQCLKLLRKYIRKIVDESKGYRLE